LFDECIDADDEVDAGRQRIALLAAAVATTDPSFVPPAPSPVSPSPSSPSSRFVAAAPDGFDDGSNELPRPAGFFRMMYMIQIISQNITAASKVNDALASKSTTRYEEKAAITSDSPRSSAEERRAAEQQADHGYLNSGYC
jgi:hypothetical protein